jgi:Plant mobile domain
LTREDENDISRPRARFSDNACAQEVGYYPRAYMMDLFSLVMFPVHFEYFQTMYLQFICNIDSPPRYSWASAVLTHLYRDFCDASENDATEISGSLMLLQMWVCTRFPLGRPTPYFLPNGLQGQAFGARWRAPHVFADEAHRSIILYRHRINNLTDSEVKWWPYQDLMQELPEVCRYDTECEMWFYNGPLILFWMIEWYTTKRVMRPFGIKQLIPPPHLIFLDDLHDVRHELRSQIRGGSNVVQGGHVPYLNFEK